MAKEKQSRVPQTIQSSSLRRRRRVAHLDAWPTGDPEAVRPVVRGESLPLFAAGIVLGFFALLLCYAKGYLLLYGDAVAHLGIARRILDARYPGIAQLGGVWLPLPHLLMLPFIGKMEMWQSGMAAAPMSILSFAASVAGMWRLARRLMRLRWALVATTFYALNPNLLYLATTAMTEALFLALLIWTLVAAVEGVAAIRAGDLSGTRQRMLFAGLLILGQVFTRYDGWIIGAAVWCCFAVSLWRSSQEFRKRMAPVFLIFTILCIAGPLLWFWYNAHFEGDWLDFMRGPYSAKMIERKTAPPGQHYRGWHNVGWAALFYMRTAQVDAAVWESGFILMFAALYAAWSRWKQRLNAAISSRADSFALLLWVPLPFYIYSIAYGSVPIFIPQLWPHSFYNARYGMELLPALSLYGALGAEQLDVWLRASSAGWARIGARLWQPAAMVLCVLNCVGMMYHIPLVLKEGMVNATTRVPFERALATAMQQMPLDEPVMMSVTAHVGAVQVAGRTLQSMVSENDQQRWEQGLAHPAASAAYVIAMKGDPVSDAVTQHPDGLLELSVICTSGQPCARVYKSLSWHR